MRIIHRLLIMLGVLGLLFLAAFYIQDKNQHTQIALFYQDQKEKLSRLFSQVISLESSALEGSVFNLTYWDELIDFTRGKNPSFATQVLDHAIGTGGIDFLWVFDQNTQKVYFNSLYGPSPYVNLPFEPEDLPDLFANSPFIHFHFMLPGGLLVEVRGATLHPSNDSAHQTPAQGYVFAGQLWGDSRLAHLSELTGSKVEVIDRTQLPPQSNDPFDPIVVAEPLPSLSGEPIGFVQGTFQNQFAAGYRQVRQRDLTFYILFAGLFLGLLVGGLTLWVTSPLRLLSASLERNSREPLKPLLNNRTEFGYIARQIDLSFDQQELMAIALRRHEATEKALRESEERYRIVTELISDAAFALHITPDGKIHLDWGIEGLSRLTGYQGEAFSELDSIRSLILPEDLPQLDARLDQLRAGQPLAIELRILHADGQIRWVRLHLYPVLAPSSKTLEHIFGAAQDITARKNAQAAYRELVENSPLGLAIFQEGVIRFSNTALQQFSGYSAEEILSFTPSQVMQLIHPGDRVGIEEAIQRAFQSTKPRHAMELRIRARDGGWHWFEVMAAPIDYQGKPALQIAFNDISGRKKAEHALMQQQEYASAILNTVDTLVMVCDRHGFILHINPAGLRILHLNEPEVLGKSLWEVFSIPIDSPLAEKHFRELIETRSPVRNLDLWLRHPDGRVWLSWSQSYLLDDDGDVMAVVGTANDINERKLRERQREAITAIASAVRASSTRRDVANLTLKAVNDFMQVESIAVGFPDPQAQYIYLEYVAGSLQDRLLNQKLPMENSISGEVFRTGKPYLTNNLKAERDFYTKDLLGALNAAAWVPMMADGNVLGIILVSSSHPIDVDEFNALLPIADMAASAIHRAMLAEQMQQRLQHLTALRTINVSISSSFDLRVTLNVLVNQIHTQLGVDAVCVLLLEPNTRLLRYVAGTGFRSRAVEELRFWLGEGQAGRVALERRGQQIYDPSGIQSYFINREWLALEDFVAYHAVPLVVKGEIKGVLETFHRPPFTHQSDFMQLLEALALETAIAIDKAELLEMLQRSNQDLIIAYDKTIEGWAHALELRDQDTEGHTRRVAEWTTRLAQACGITGAQLMHIRRGAFLHDLGKIGVPDEILRKDGSLSPEEWEIMRQHPRLAYEMLSSIEFLRPALEIPYCHHEHWDGSGYPRGLAGDEIPLSARIFSVIDVWDALRHDRPYRKAWTEAETVAYLKEQAGKVLDPEIVRIFLELRALITRPAPEG
ncbi:MAG TPA: PAS domain S-box protein [Anaerolinea thermolimosa]|uniref:PAS domain S-box protein n=1 Tax=Anaerolinea thermolimosa TaxID=229919 RepID=A0A3D1JF60_9CHLR|nr:PAS domain S-box protein [Anaerolinea thermolimosa]GAP07263.1 protein containing PAS domain S-box [Anaerolinea thermolimosa]HCE17231.1 PAS domain S-box protein [Anaerolinea thermolimosa]